MFSFWCILISLKKSSESKRWTILGTIITTKIPNEIIWMYPWRHVSSSTQKYLYQFDWISLLNSCLIQWIHWTEHNLINIFFCPHKEMNIQRLKNICIQNSVFLAFWYNCFLKRHTWVAFHQYSNNHQISSFSWVGDYQTLNCTLV